ncbi:phage late control D family protein [Salmonella enterica]|nr:phage late control D family protein [Salmonella enterica]EJH7441515.1 phage late control D family protein [Salmonella enterica]
MFALAPLKVVHGVVTDFSRLSDSRDEAEYRIVLEPYLALLRNQMRSWRFFLNKSVPDVVKQVLDEHDLHGWEYVFDLKQSYPVREQINQANESDLAFIERLLSETGIYYRFTLQPDTQTEIINFSDSQQSYEFGKTLPLSHPSGMNDGHAESVWNLSVRHRVVEASVTTKDYNYREAQKILMSAPADMTRGEGEGLTYGDVRHYKLRHLDTGSPSDPEPETANFWARLDHERFLARQTVVRGVSTAPWLAAGQVLMINNSTPFAVLPAVLESPVVITRVRFAASRKDALRVNLRAVPRERSSKVFKKHTDGVS